MFVAAAKAGLGIAVVLTVLGVAETHSITQTAVLFLAAGLVPGLNVQIPGEVALVVVAGCLMLIAAWVASRYAARRAAINKWLPRYARPMDDPGYEDLVPGLKALKTGVRMAETKAIEAYGVLRFWIKHASRIAVGQLAVVRNDLTDSVRLYRWRQRQARSRFDNSAGPHDVMRLWAAKARAYVARLTAR